MGSGLRREKFSPVLRNPECLVGQIVCKNEPDSPPTGYACPFLCGFAALPNKGHSSFPLEFCTSCKPRPQETCKRKRSSIALLPERESGGQRASIPYLTIEHAKPKRWQQRRNVLMRKNLVYFL